MKMMKTSKKRTFQMLLFLFLLSATACVFSAAQVFAAGVSRVDFSDANFEREYAVGSTVVLPDVTASKGGNDYATEKTLVFPDGKVKGTARETFTEAGQYSAVYSAWIDGFKYEKKFDFIVKEALFGFERQPGNAVYDGDKDLIELKMGANNPFQYHSVIDLSDNNLTTPFLEMYNVASQDGERDCEQIIVTLTDVDNENNYIQIRINAAPDFKTYDYTYDTSYVAVSVNGAEFKGKDGDKIHMGNAYGRPVAFSFCNRGFRATPENDRLQLYYLADRAQIYAYGTASPTFGGLVVDFRSEDFYKEFWEGFSVDKCRLSVYAAKLKTATVDFFVTGIDGQDLSRGFVEDRVGPELTIDAPEEIPFGIAGCAYRVFDSAARDDFGVASTSVSAYYDYDSGFPVSVSIENGKFYPVYQGVYTLVYRAVDRYGNESVKTVPVRVDGASIASPLGISVSQDFANCLAGARVDLKEYAVVSDEKYGDTAVNVSAACGNKVAEIKDDAYFYANAVGEWKVRYEVTDNLGRKAFAEKTFTALPNPDPVFGETEDSGPKYLLSGRPYEIPDVKAYRYGADRAEEITPQVRYSLNGETGTVTGGSITPVYRSGEDNLLTLTYFVGSVEYPLSKQVVQTFKEGKLTADGMFFVRQGNAARELRSSGILFTATEDATIDFVVPVLTNALETEIEMLEGNLTIVVADENNAARRLEIGIRFEGGKSIVSLNGVKKDTYQRSSLRIAVENDQLKIESSSFRIREYADGEAFAGFDGKRTAVSFRMQAGTQAEIRKVANQPISDYGSDVVAPTYLLDGSYRLNYEIGAEVVIPRLYAVDAVSGECAVKVSVWANGKYVRATDGRLLQDLDPDSEAKFIASEYGYYLITYQTSDQAGNELELPYLINVPDKVKPEITVNGNVSESAKVGDKIRLPEATASDNISEDLQVTVFAIDPTLGYATVKNGEITLTKAGSWTVRFFAMDEAGNIAYKDYRITVREG